MTSPSGTQIGIDLGGTKIAAIALSPSGEILFEKRIATPKGDYHATMKLVAGLIDEAAHAVKGETSVGIGTPGSLSPKTGRLRNSNSIWMNDQPVAEDLEHLTGRTLRFANDANCFALSEAVDGAGRGASCVFGVIIGTGTGGGVVVNNTILHGANGIGGEWGHNPLPWPDKSELPPVVCWCGRENCHEVWLSGSGLERDHKMITGHKLTGAEISAEAQSGNEEARATLDRHARRLAKSLATVVNVIDPDTIVLGGGLSKLEHLYVQLPELMIPWVFSDVLETKIVAPVHGDASGVRGAARLWNR